MKTTISHNDCIATFNHNGAELISFKRDDREFIWDGNPKFWEKHSPILFPIVGTLKNNQYQYKNQTYSLSRHGFARDMEFELTEKSENRVVFSLKSSAETLKIYPFEFELQIIYTLENNKLSVAYKVFNNRNEKMYFSIGAHPAFALPNGFENYSLSFEKQDSLKCSLLENGLLSDNTKTISLKDGDLKLDYSLFENDALILKDFKGGKILVSEDSKPFLKIEFQDFPDLGIWTKPNAPFLCIEPWFGYSDTADSSGNLEDKNGIQKLESQSYFTSKYEIEIL